MNTNPRDDQKRVQNYISKCAAFRVGNFRNARYAGILFHGF